MEQYWTNNENLKSEIKEVEYKVLDNSFIFYTDAGVFSKDKIDYGSDLLINTYLLNHSKHINILDVGCGYGVIGLTLALLTKSKVDLIDVNKRSVHLTKMNIKKYKLDSNAFYSDAYEFVDKKYDVIITNPPIRVGKEKLFEILEGAKNHLKKSGELWAVIRKDQGALSTMKHLENIYNIEIKNKKKGYLIFCAKNK